MRVALFATCLVDLLRPSVGFAAVKLLEQAGCEVEVPLGQTCCGQPAYNNGDKKTAIQLAKQMIDTFYPYDCVVIPSGSPPQTWAEVRNFASSIPSDRHYTIDSLTGTVEFGPLIQEPSRHVRETKFRATQTQLPVLGNYSTRLVGNIDGTWEK